jgi:hypothetical protein
MTGEAGMPDAHYWEDLIGRLEKACGERDDARVEAVATELEGAIGSDGATSKVVGKALMHLRRKRYFATLERIAEKFLDVTAEPAREVNRMYAQALIDQGYIDRAIGVLTVLQSEDRPEAIGLLGRSYKQIYVNATNPTPKHVDALRKSLKYYYDIYDGDPTRQHIWHGINVVALLVRAKEDGVTVDSRYRDYRELAQEVLATATPMAAKQAWAAATALEASIALGDIAGVFTWADRYIHSDGDAFEFASTLRQLEEVWRLRRRGTQLQDPIAGVLPIITKRLDELGGPGAAGLSPSPATQAQMQAQQAQTGQQSVGGRTQEAIYGNPGFATVETIEKAYRCRDAIAMVNDRAGAAKGTGFVASAVGLNRRWKDGTVFVTNAHVIGPQGLAPGEASISFTTLAAEKPYRVKSVLWTSPPSELDVAIVELDREVHKTIGEAALDPMDGGNLRAAPPQRLFLCGHPRGGKMVYSLHGENTITRVSRDLVHYLSSTDEGSSGSPVFDYAWDLVAIHRGNDGDVKANYGSRLDAVRERIAEEATLGRAATGG